MVLPHLPNGRAIKIKSLEDQTNALNKLHIVDWKRAGYPYETEFEGEEYHLISNHEDKSL